MTVYKNRRVYRVADLYHLQIIIDYFHNCLMPILTFLRGITVKRLFDGGNVNSIFRRASHVESFDVLYNVCPS